MTGKIKALGLAFVAIAAMSMVAAGGAQAAQLHATTGTTAAIFGNQINGAQQQHQFVIDAGSVKCTQAFFEGLVTNGEATQTTAQELQLTPTYAGCLISGLAATVDTNGCKFTITGTGQPEKTVQVDIVGCTAGKQITVTSATCTVTVPEQNNLSHIKFVNIPGAAPHDVEADIQVAGITYQTHGTCPNTASDHTSQTTTGTYTGKATFRATKHVGSEQKTHGKNEGAVQSHHVYQALKQTGQVVGLIAT